MQNRSLGFVLIAHRSEVGSVLASLRSATSEVQLSPRILLDFVGSKLRSPMLNFSRIHNPRSDRVYQGSDPIGSDPAF